MRGASESRGESEWWCTHVPWDPTRKNSGQKKLVLASGVDAQMRGPICISRESLAGWGVPGVWEFWGCADLPKKIGPPQPPWCPQPVRNAPTPRVRGIWRTEKWYPVSGIGYQA